MSHKPINFPLAEETLQEEANKAVRDAQAQASKEAQTQTPPFFEMNDFTLTSKFQVAIEAALGACSETVRIEGTDETDGEGSIEVRLSEDKEAFERLESLTRSYAQMASGTAARRTSLQDRPAPIIQVPK